MMKTCVVTGGIGRCAEAARMLASRANELHGWPVVILNESMVPELPSPHWMKAFIWDAVTPDIERIVWLDADTFIASPLEPLPDAPFAAREDLQESFDAEKKVFAPSGECQKYFNAGVFVCARETRRVFDRMKTVMHGPRGNFYDQTWMNIWVQRELGGFLSLPRSWNWLVLEGAPPPDVRIIHYAGSDPKTRWRDLETLYRHAAQGLPVSIP